MKILIGYDGSECADAALTDLKRAGLPGEAEVLILSAADVFLPPETQGETDEEVFPLYVPHGVKLARERAAKAFAEAEKFAARGAQKIREMFPRWQVTAEAKADTPHWAIIARAEEWKPDLLVVGSQGRTAFGRFVLGSVSQKVLYEASCSVRISRGRDLPADRSVKLILGTDGSPDADAMVEAVAARNWGKGTQIKLVTAVEAFHQYAEEPDAQLDRIRDIQTMAIKKLTGAGLEAEAVLTDEDPKKYLVRQAKKWDADCIFLGAKGHSFFERVLIGSVSSAVAARAGCSVEVVRTVQK
jgi:nucleotide-binding universal stress UspA family protein